MVTFRDATHLKRPFKLGVREEFSFAHFQNIHSSQFCSSFIISFIDESPFLHIRNSRKDAKGAKGGGRF